MTYVMHVNSKGIKKGLEPSRIKQLLIALKSIVIAFLKVTTFAKVDNFSTSIFLNCFEFCLMKI